MFKEHLSYQACTQQYRAPELLFGSTAYGPALDIWSCGCIMAELMQRTPLFPGNDNDEIDQLSKIFLVTGTPLTQRDFEAQPSSSSSSSASVAFPPEVLAAREWRLAEQLPGFVHFNPSPGIPLNKIFSSASPDAIDLLSQMLRLNPEKRISAQNVSCVFFFFTLF